MGAYILALSILLQFSAAATAILQAYRKRKVSWYILSLAIFLMGVRRCLTLYRVLVFDQAVDVSAETVALTISVLVLVGIVGIFRSSSRSSEGLSAFTSPEKALTLRRLTHTGLLLGAVTILSSVIIGYSSFIAGREASYQRTFDSNLALAQALASEANRHSPNRSTVETLSNIGKIASDMGISREGGFVCAIHPDGVLALHTQNPEYVGINIGNVPVQSDTYDTLGQLASSQEDWVGNYTPANGEAQIVASAYSSALDMSLLVHVPQASIEAAYRAQTLPWSIGLAVLIVFLIPLSMGFLYIAFAATFQNSSKATHALQKSEERYRLLADHVSDIIFATDLDLNFTYLSPSFERLTGHSSDDTGKIPIQSTVTPESLECIQKFIQDEIKIEEEGADPDRSTTLQLDLVRLDGKIIPVETKVTYTRDAEGKPIGFVGVSRDISERVEAESQRRELEEQLQHSQKMEAVGTLAGGIAHDFNNILHAILGFSTLAQEKDTTNDELEQYLDEISIGASRGAELVNQIQTFSRSSEAIYAPVELQKILQEALKLLRGSLPSTINIHTEISTKLSLVYGDSTQIHQIIMNLCTNAYQAMEEMGGTLKLSLKNTAISDEDALTSTDLNVGEYLLLTVSDVGCGISAENLQRIFDPFFTTKDIGKGTGLGLSVIHGIVKNMGGAIRVQSVEGKGSTFEVYWPAFNATDSPSANRISKTISAQIERKERILFIDDEVSIVKFIRMAFEQRGLHVDAFTSSTEAFKVFSEHPEQYDIVITDLTMPNMSGKELADKIHMIRKHIPILLCTGMREYDDNPTELERIGIVECLGKPIVIDDLCNAIKRHCEKVKLTH